MSARRHENEEVRLPDAQWRLQLTVHQKALACIRRAHKFHLATIDAAEADFAGPRSLDADKEPFAALQLDISEAILKGYNSVENRIEKIQEYLDELRNTLLEQMRQSSVSEANGALRDFFDGAGKVRDFFLELATNKLKYLQIAVQFLTGKTQPSLVKYFTMTKGKVATPMLLG